MSTCADPASINGGTILTTGPYNNGSYAVFACTSGYSMSGNPYTTCISGVWDYTPTCIKGTDIIVISKVTADSCNRAFNVPEWLYYIVGATMVVFGLFFLIATLMCLLHLCRCRRHYYAWGSNDRCCCKGRQPSYTTFSVGNGSYNGEVQTTSQMTETTDGPDSPTSPRTRFVNVVEKAIRPPAKVIGGWMPHANPVRSINTSTK